MWTSHTRTAMGDRTTAHTVVEHVVETDERGRPRIGAREVVDETPTAPAAGERERTRLSER